MILGSTFAFRCDSWIRALRLRTGFSTAWAAGFSTAWAAGFSTAWAAGFSTVCSRFLHRLCGSRLLHCLCSRPRERVHPEDMRKVSGFLGFLLLRETFRRVSEI